ncbi:MAG: phosphoribosyl-ATP diphosphatase [Pseudomonadota bacterium]|nr:phosphoribosyl-ATP diphosphatase [Pseudomonadota bacterium]
MEDIFEKLEKIIEMRQNERPENSYVAELWKKGDDFILKKIGEESAELIIASKNKNEDEILNELADVLFHAIVLLKYNGLSILDVAEVLKKRLGKSGIEEKKTRSK